MLVFLSGLALFLQFSPRVVLTPSESLDPTNPFFSPLILSNDGYLSIYNVSYGCRVKDVEWANNSSMSMDVDAQFVHSGQRPVPEIRPAGKTTIDCAHAGQTINRNIPVKSARIEVIVNFRPRLWFTRNETFSFETVTDKAGTLRWIPAGE